MQPNRVVYDTSRGRTDRCSFCKWRMEACVCPTGSKQARGGIVRVSREHKGRRGKGVTVISGLIADDATLAGIASTLKRFSGAGGTVRNGAVEIQGDHREKVAARLRELGHKVKLAGG